MYHLPMEKKLTSFDLKVIACISMFIDHFGAILVYQLIMRSEIDYLNSIYSWVLQNRSLMIGIYNNLRIIGRIAFPIYCFLLVEGFFYTKSRAKYLRNLVVFALVSEVPFDLLLYGKIGFEAQNVFFTLAIALGMIWGITKIKEKWVEEPVISVFLQGSLILAGCVSALLLNTDYSYYGIVLAAIFYYYRNNRFLACLVGYVWFLFEPWCFPAFIALLCYNGKRGISIKYFFYAFYPAHLLLLYGLRVLLIGK